MRMGLSRLDKPDARRIAPVCQYPGRVLTGSHQDEESQPGIGDVQEAGDAAGATM